MIFSRVRPRAPTKEELTLVCGFLVASVDRLGQLIERVEGMDDTNEALDSMREQREALKAVADSIYPRDS